MRGLLTDSIRVSQIDQNILVNCFSSNCYSQRDKLFNWYLSDCSSQNEKFGHFTLARFLIFTLDHPEQIKTFSKNFKCQYILMKFWVLGVLKNFLEPNSKIRLLQDLSSLTGSASCKILRMCCKNCRSRIS